MDHGNLESFPIITGYGTYQDQSTAVTSGHKKNMKNPETLAQFYCLDFAETLKVLVPRGKKHVLVHARNWHQFLTEGRTPSFI